MERRSVLLLVAVVVVAGLAGSVGASCPDGFQLFPHGACVKLFTWGSSQFFPSWDGASEDCKKEEDTAILDPHIRPGGLLGRLPFLCRCKEDGVRAGAGSVEQSCPLIHTCGSQVNQQNQLPTHSSSP
ncbi:hypothetical protein O3P69_005515 [Scylla paramamosain]|uniref:Uncharacterized protein n=1 Tax=Scylla paramamosain TaxID=85552 RepID=A0AAW0U9X4_SCYPA